MNDRYYWIFFSGPEPALEFLALSAEKMTPEDRKIFEGLKLEISDRCTVLIPDAYFMTGPDETVLPLKRGVDTLIETNGGRCDRTGVLEANAAYYSVPEGCFRLFFEAQRIAPSGPQDGKPFAKTEELLLVGPGIETQTAMKQISNAAFHATASRASIADNSKNGHTVAFVHAVDSRNRASILGGALDGGKFPEFAACLGYRYGDYTVFLPRESELRAGKALDCICRLVLARPSLFEGENRPPRSGPLFALTAIPENRPDTLKSGADSTRHDFYYLNHLIFRSLPATGAGVKQTGGFAVHALENSAEQLEILEREIKENVRDAGYRLRLKQPFVYPFDPDQEWDRLIRQKADLEFRLSCLEQVSRPRPTLLRFTEKQLPALAEVLRELPMETIRDGRLEYGYQAVENAGRNMPAAFHYVLVDPEIGVPYSFYPAYRWEKLDPEYAMIFHLDPSWARDYRDQNPGCHVFVPDGTFLCPFMHGWKIQDMDRHLRDTMGQWFHGKHGVADIPQRPIYLFDRDPQHPEGIRINVLNRDHFNPLKTKLGWLNHNLNVYDQLADQGNHEDQIRRMSTSENIVSLSKKFARKAFAAKEEFDKRAETVAKDMAKNLDTLTDTLTREWENIASSADSAAKGIGRSRQYLADLHAVKQDVEGLHAEITELSRQSAKYRRILEKVMENFDSFILDKVVEEVDARRTRATEKFNTRIESFKNACQNVDKRLDRMLQLFKK